jgi:hypothetical protein
MSEKAEVNRLPVSRPSRGHQGAYRMGAASLDYVLLLGVILPLAAFILTIAPRIIRLAYEMASVMISWPFM